MDNYNYPWGADNANAPWNKSEPEEIEREVEYSCVMKRTAEVGTTNYVGGGTYAEWDGEGYITAVEEPDFDNTNWLEEWKNAEYTPIDLIEKLKEIATSLAKGEMPQRPEGSRKNYWNILAKACTEWVQEDEYCEMV